MNQCPKCGGLSIGGPHYRMGSASDGWFGERLEYNCMTCGYTCRIPTLDNRAPRDPREDSIPKQTGGSK